MVAWSGRRFTREGAIVFDGQSVAFRRTVRRFLRGLRLPCNGAISYGLESVTADELVLVRKGTRETWTRAPAD
jgi:hypothetical protein